jgi:hypothetical protein
MSYILYAVIVSYHIPGVVPEAAAITASILQGQLAVYRYITAAALPVESCVVTCKERFSYCS